MNDEEEHPSPDKGEYHEVTVVHPIDVQPESVPEPIAESAGEVAIVEPEIEDDKWYGVPPAGERPTPEKWIYVLMIFFVMVIEIGIWAVYRYFSAPYFENFGTLTFYLAHIIAAPTIHLIPILIFWRFFRKERGLPFVFTKKLLMSAVIVGFLAAIIWRVLQQLSFDALSGSAGGTVSGTFNFFNLFAASNITLFSVMTFVHFFIVGPVEELEFRSFAYDQSARVLHNWQAVLFSSVLFGCSHIPIALFVYQFPPHIFVVALFGWISAGVVFGALYAWSRNIFACIVMHGMGNWQLSVYYFQSAETGAMGVGSIVAVDIATTLIADGAMIVIFFLVHRYYWQPHRSGEPAFGGAFTNFQKFLHEHDFMQRPLKTTAVFLVAFIVLTCAIIMGFTHALGERDLSLMYASESSGSTEEGFLESYVEESDGWWSDTEILYEGAPLEFSPESQPERYIYKINVRVTWTDEEDMQYGFITLTNDPDTVSIEISGPNASAENSASNPHGGEGMVELEFSYTREDIAQIIENEGDDYTTYVWITLEDAGDYTGPAGNVIFTDTQNEITYEWEFVWLVPEK
jgi:membrane protease YdiL (CAAX protease family)